MEQRDLIAYNHWLENLNEPAPEGAWDSIVDQLDIDDAWDTISETLDLDDVWQNIEANLPAGVAVPGSINKHFPKIFWLAAALILLTLTTPLVDQTSQVEEKYAPASLLRDVQTPTTKPEEISKQATATLSIKIADKKPSHRTDFSKKTEALDPVDFTQEGFDKKEPLLINLSDQIETASAECLESDLSDEHVAEKIKISNVADSVPCVAEETYLEKVSNEKRSERARWTVGVIGSIKNTWLINPETTNGLKRSSLNDTEITFGKEFGVTIERGLGRKSSVQFEYYFYSEIGQRYHEYINALYQTKDIKLHYQKAQLVYRRRVFEKISRPAFYGIAGLRISRLRVADASIGGEDEVVTQEYKPWDYGFILGGEAELKLTNRILLVSGIRASYGMRNIYLGNGQSPAEFNKTHTASVGLSLGVKYRIP